MSHCLGSRRAVLCGVFTALVWTRGLTAVAQPGVLWEGNANLGKVSSQLLKARHVARQGRGGRGIEELVPGLPVRNHLLDIEVRFSALGTDIVARLTTIGMRVTGVYYRSARLYGQCDPALLDQIVAIPEVTGVYPNYPAIHNAGVVTSQADVSIRTDQARSTFGVDGLGVQVGVLSGSFNSLIGGAVSGTGCARTLTGAVPQQSGDLPSTVTLLENGPGDIDEGAAMAELIHDLAPGAGIMFHTALGGEAAMAHGIDQLRSCGADVIIDDLTYQLAPMFQDGLVAQAAQRAVDDGIPYFSSAANLGRIGASEPYRDANPNADDQAVSPTGNDLHRFGSGSPFAAITFPPACAMQLVLQWSEPFSGVLGPGASSDLDFYALDAPNTAAQVIDSSAMSQGCRRPGGGAQGDPIEGLFVSNNGSDPGTAYFAIEHVCGDESVRFRILAIPTGCPAFAFAVDPAVFNQAQISGHAAAAGVAAVASVFYAEIDTGGNVFPPNGQINVELLSALGGSVPFYFTGDGQPLPGAPVNRFKPDIAAPTGTNTSFFGIDDTADPDTFPNFFGTSAAAPHAAAVAALMRHANPALSPAALLQAMRATARDIESVGRDPLSGDGLIDALSAVAAVAPSATATVTLTSAATHTPTATPTRTRTPTRSPTPSATRTSTVTRTPSRTPSVTISVTPTRTRTPTASPTSTATHTLTQAATATPTQTPSPSASPTPTTTATSSATSTATPTVAVTVTPTHTPTPTATEAPTPTHTLAVASLTRTPSPTRSATQTGTATGTLSGTPTDTATLTTTRTRTPTATETSTSTHTPTRTATSTQTAPPGASRTPTPSPTQTTTSTATPTLTRTASPTATPPPTLTATATMTHTRTSTATRTMTAAITPTATSTVSATATHTPTPTTTCAGDCNGDTLVTVNELLIMVNVALGNASIAACRAGDRSHDEQITVDEILLAVNSALSGCPQGERLAKLKHPICEQARVREDQVARAMTRAVGVGDGA